MSLTKMDRKVRPEIGNNGSCPTPGGVAAFALAISAALRAEYSGSGSAVKLVAMLTGANPRAVKNWFEARNAPTGYHLVLLARHSDEVFRLILAEAGRKESLVVLDVATAKAALARAAATLAKIG